MSPIDALRRIAFLLEVSLAPTYRTQAFRKAVIALQGYDDSQIADLAKTNRLKSIKGIGDTTERVVQEALTGNNPAYLEKLEGETVTFEESTKASIELRQALKGDCHTHSFWSDGTTDIIDMARAARALGHEYIVLTDHSPRLTVANGLTRERLEQELEVVAQVNETMSNEDAPPFRLLTGIEVDILSEGGLDQDADILERLDIVVGSVHSELKMEKTLMTKRMIAAIENPNLDILGHCTGRKVMGKERAQSQFDHEAVFKACEASNTAVEINCRPERRDPPRDLLKMAVDLGCNFSIDTDAHAPGHLDWQYIGCVRGVECGVTADRVINTRSATDLLANRS